jgi:hypothetical protein
MRTPQLRFACSISFLPSHFPSHPNLCFARYPTIHANPSLSRAAPYSCHASPSWSTTLPFFPVTQVRSVRISFRWKPSTTAVGAVPPPLAVRLTRAGAVVAEWAGEVLWALPGGGVAEPGGGVGRVSPAGWVTMDVTLPECDVRAGDVLQVVPSQDTRGVRIISSPIPRRMPDLPQDHRPPTSSTTAYLGRNRNESVRVQPHWET